MHYTSNETKKAGAIPAFGFVGATLMIAQGEHKTRPYATGKSVAAMRPFSSIT